MKNNKGKHLTLSERIIIEKKLYNSVSKSEIANFLGKDKSTICKEVKLRKFTSQNAFKRNDKGVRDCVFMSKCGQNGYCELACANYIKEACTRRDKSVGVCNGCDLFNKCRKTKYRYDANKANNEYLSQLVESRKGFNLTTSEVDKIANTIYKPIKNKQSLYAIIANHPELNICEKTLYTYIEAGLFKRHGINDFDLVRKVSMKKRKNKGTALKKRESRKYLIGKTYDLFKEFIEQKPNISIVEMDTVYNERSANVPVFIQTFFINNLNLLVALYHTDKTAVSMTNGIKIMKERLGEKLFNKYFQLILTDRGSEFVDSKGIEELVDNVFYCDAQASWQKPHVENAHILLRRILPKERSMYNLGLTSQTQLNKVLSHYNSYTTKEKNNGKSNFEVIEFFDEEEYRELLTKLELEKIEKDDVTMAPSILK